MKQSVLYFLVIIACSCNTAGTTPGGATKDSATATTATMNYPYSIEHPDNWEVGNYSQYHDCIKILKSLGRGKNGRSAKIFWRFYPH